MKCSLHTMVGSSWNLLVCPSGHHPFSLKSDPQLTAVSWHSGQAAMFPWKIWAFIPWATTRWIFIIACVYLAPNTGGKKLKWSWRLDCKGIYFFFHLQLEMQMIGSRVLRIGWWLTVMINSLEKRNILLESQNLWCPKHFPSFKN